MTDLVDLVERQHVDPTTGGIVLPHGTKSRRGAGAELPEALLDRFRQRRGETDPTYWGLGDDIADAVAELAAHGMQTKIIKAAALEWELSRAEVRMLFETARACDKSLRAEYGDVLTHQHFRVIRYIDDRAKQAAYLQWCLDSADAFGGRPAPASILAKKVQKDAGLEPPEPTWAELVARAVSAAERVREHADTERRSKLADQVCELLGKLV